MSVQVLLIRHAAHDKLGKMLCGLMPGVTLGEAGLRQAVRLAQSLAGSRLAAVYSSPLERALQTAEPIAKAAGLEVSSEAALQEIDFGEWSGATFEALEQDPRWLSWNDRRSLERPPGGETMQEAQTRLSRWLAALPARHGEGTVAAVTHSDMIKVAAMHVLGAPIDLHHRLEIDPASVTRLVVGDWGMKLMSMNEANP